MTKIELLEMLTKRARVFRADRDHYKRNGETVWMDLKSTRDVAKRITVLLKYYV